MKLTKPQPTPKWLRFLATQSDFLAEMRRLAAERLASPPAPVLMLCCALPHEQCQCSRICDECNRVAPGRHMHDTISGVLCLDCNERFTTAAAGVVRHFGGK
jgi:hypothetical protein